MVPAVWVIALCSLALVRGAHGEGCVATPTRSEVIVEKGMHVLLRVEARYPYVGDSSRHELWAMFDGAGNFRGNEFINFDSFNCTRRGGDVCLKRYVSITGDDEVYGKQLVLRVYERVPVFGGDTPLFGCINVTILAQNETIVEELSKINALQQNITEQEQTIVDLEAMIAENHFYRTVSYAAGGAAVTAMAMCFLLCLVLTCVCSHYRRRSRKLTDEEAAVEMEDIASIDGASVAQSETKRAGEASSTQAPALTLHSSTPDFHLPSARRTHILRPPHVSASQPREMAISHV